MTNAAPVNDAQNWADYLTKRNFKGPGDTVEAAMSRAARKAGVPFRILWSLRYRQPKRIWADVYLRLREAYENECQRQEAKLRHELTQFERIMGDAALEDPHYRAAKAALVAMEKEGAGE